MEVIAVPEKLKTDHPDYYKIQSRKSYQKIGCLKTICSHCGSTVSIRAMLVHKRSDKCLSYKSLCDDRFNVLMDELRPILRLKGLKLCKIIEEDIN